MMQIGRTVRTVRHFRPAQVFHRVRSMTRHRLLEPLLPGPPSLADPASMPEVVATPPSSPLRTPPTAEGPVSILGRETSLSPSISWSDPDWLDGTLLSRFHLHYHDYLSQLPDASAAALLLDWIEANPASASGAWKVSWHPYVISVRTVAWMQLLANRPRLLGTESRSVVMRSLVAQLRHLERNLEKDVGGNHLVRNTRALAWGAAFFDGSDANRWHRIASESLHQILGEQILADGFHFERSPSYHLQVFADLIECRSVIPASLLANRLDKTLADMAQVAVDITHPDGLPSLMADGGLHMTPPTTELTDAMNKVTGRPVPSPSDRFSYPEGGYHGFRSHRLYLLVDCGPIGADHLPAHGHGDILSFELSVDGLRFIVDPGVYEYETGVRRDYSRSTAAHNTVTLDGLDQAEFWSSFRVGRRPSDIEAHLEADGDTFRLVGSHDGYRHLRGGPIHERRFVAGAQIVTVSDVIKGGAGQSVRSAIVLHPDVEAERSDDGWLLSRANSIVELTTNASSNLEPAEWCPDIGTAIPTSRIVLDYGNAPISAECTLQLAT